MHIFSSKLFLTCISAFGLFLAMFGSAQATITVFTDRTSFEAAITGAVTEDFNDLALASPLVSITGTGTGPNWGASGTSPGKLWDVIDAGTGVPDTTFSFSNNMYAFGGDWDLSPGGPGTGISVLSSNGMLTSVGDIVNPSSTTAYTGFWGFISTDAFTAVSLAEGSSCCVETYTLDNLTYTSHSVPEPGTLALMGVALLGLAITGRRKLQVRAG